MKLDDLSDAELFALKEKENVNIFLPLYMRYMKYAYVIIGNILQTTYYYNALYEERDSIFYDSLNAAIITYEAKRGEFHSFLSTILSNRLKTRIREFSHDPLSNCVSLDAKIKGYKDLTYNDSFAIADDSDPNSKLNEKDTLIEYYQEYRGRNPERVNKMIQMKLDGYTYEEIAKYFHCSAKTIQGIFTHLKDRINNKHSF